MTSLTSPADIIRLGMSFSTAKCLLTGLRYDLFGKLADGPLDAGQVQAELGLHERGVRDFLSVLVNLGLLQRDGQRYRNSTTSERYLVRDSPSYVGGFLERADRMLYPAWGRLDEMLRTGRPTAEADYLEMVRDPGRLRQFLGMMDALTTLIGPELAQALDWSGHRSVLDLGGARGNLVAGLVKAHPHLRGGVFDLPVMAEPFAEHMAALGLTDRVAFHGGDFFRDDLPAAEVIVVGHVLHDWAPEQCRAIVRKAYAALEPGGVLVVYDRMVDDGLTDLTNLVVSLSMMLTTEGGAEYTPGEYRSWLEEAGFRVGDARQLGETDTLLVGIK
ncbi:methyltransferase [Actinokineospora enzanensis]|uniref:methyltransferase n=1 Tax=Actinokineospora enzanensis TaxID=155975 RepID=UPI000365FD6F|nr:methyltransferase [Actinokineospora enzanensis]